MKMTTLWRALAPVTLAMLAAGPATALEAEYVPDEEAGDLDEVTDGWYHTVNLGIGLSVGTSRDVVGQEDGATITFSVDATWRAELFAGQHEFRNTLSINEAVSRTPLVDNFVKSNDRLQNEAIWFYHLPSVDWFGPFARASLQTSIFNGHDVRANRVDYERFNRSDELTTFSNRARLQLTRPFQPTTLKESVGVFVEPLRQEALNVDIRLGVGARQVFANGNYVVSEVIDAGTRPDQERDIVILNELETFSQAGSELAIEAFGNNPEGDINYRLGFEMMTPFYNSVENSTLNAWEATNYEGSISVAFAARDWLSVSYGLNALKSPQLVDEWQLTNQLLVTITQTFRSTPETRNAGSDVVDEMEAEAAAEAGDEAVEAADAAAQAADDTVEAVEEEVSP